MNPLKQLFANLNLSEEQLQDLATSFQQNPMAALAKIQALPLPPDFLSQAMGIMMAHPNAMTELAASFGIDSEAIANAQASLQGSGPKPGNDDQ
jgi:hypothetical protein